MSTQCSTTELYAHDIEGYQSWTSVGH